MPPKRKASKAAAATIDDVDFSKKTVAQLKQECTKQGLDTSGKKGDLVSRLEGTSGGSSSKKKKTEEPTDERTERKKAIEALKSADKGKVKQFKVDKTCPLANASGSSVVENYDCMLNQTNIGFNNNKYYVIQVLQQYSTYYTWNRWGRVGEPGQNNLKQCGNVQDAINDFKKKFKDKTKNDWDKRAKFEPVPGKYTMIEVEGDADDADAEEISRKLDEIDGTPKKVANCTLDKGVQDFIKLIFNEDMFKFAMTSFNIDVKKMPLGKLSKSQLAKGFECLEEIGEVLQSGSKKNLDQLTSKFYTLIPHDFGRQRPPVISDDETLQKKFDMLMVLGDIELAQTLQKEKGKKGGGGGDTTLQPHPLDNNYQLLNATIASVDKKSKEYKVLETYLRSTEKGGWWGSGNNCTIQNIMKLDRVGEDNRYGCHDTISNRKLMWHGTNVAVVAAIIKSGLRIMPHSGGRVGRGIYFASEHNKSAGYVGRTSDNVGIMFLTEVALGKEHHITRDDSSLKAAPKGCDCVIAKGQSEPDPKLDTTLTIEGKKVVVPQGKPIKTKFTNSSFGQSEYLVYKESQARLRYILKIKW